jgi:hypothetical protein
MSRDILFGCFGTFPLGALTVDDCGFVRNAGSRARRAAERHERDGPPRPRLG